MTNMILKMRIFVLNWVDGLLFKTKIHGQFKTITSRIKSKAMKLREDLLTLVSSINFISLTPVSSVNCKNHIKQMIKCTHK